MFEVWWDIWRLLYYKFTAKSAGVKDFWKSVKICRYYGQEYSGCFFDSWCSCSMSVLLHVLSVLGSLRYISVWHCIVHRWLSGDIHCDSSVIGYMKNSLANGIVSGLYIATWLVLSWTRVVNSNAVTVRWLLSLELHVTLLDEWPLLLCILFIHLCVK